MTLTQKAFQARSGTERMLGDAQTETFTMNLRWISPLTDRLLLWTVQVVCLPFKAEDRMTNYINFLLEINAWSSEKVVRIYKMITIEKMLWPFINFSELILKRNACRSVWRFSKWILRLKGSTSVVNKDTFHANCELR